MGEYFEERNIMGKDCHGIKQLTKVAYRKNNSFQIMLFPAIALISVVLHSSAIDHMALYISFEYEFCTNLFKSVPG